MNSDTDFHNSFFKRLNFYRELQNGIINIGHRGSSEYYPENTMVSFREAYAMKADMIELDVQLSKDGIPVVMHDFTLNRTTNGSGFLSNYILSDIKKLDAGSWFSPKFAGVRIPILEEVLQFAKDKVNVNIEIKAHKETKPGETEEKCLALVEKYGMKSRVLFSSFSNDSVRYLRDLDSEIVIGLLYARTWKRKIQPFDLVECMKTDTFHCSKGLVKKKWIQNLNVHQIPVFIYTVNKSSTMKKLIEWGVTGIFTNRPDLLTGILANYKAP